MNRKDLVKLTEMRDKLNEWVWPAALGSRPPRFYTVEDKDDIRVAFRLLDALVRWAGKRTRTNSAPTKPHRIAAKRSRRPA